MGCWDTIASYNGITFSFSNGFITGEWLCQRFNPQANDPKIKATIATTAKAINSGLARWIGPPYQLK